MKKKQARKDINRQKNCITDADHDYILDVIERRDHIKYRIEIHNDDK